MNEYYGRGWNSSEIEQVSVWKIVLQLNDLMTPICFTVMHTKFSLEFQEINWGDKWTEVTKDIVK
jgi:hypothetical protein